MKTIYHPAQVIIKDALCDNCGHSLKYVKSDFSRQKFCWLHFCEKCHKSYWLDNRYPLTDYMVDLSNTLTNIKTDPIECEEG
jgi:uncharacterized protein with PIN domain